MRVFGVAHSDTRGHGLDGDTVEHGTNEWERNERIDRRKAGPVVLRRMRYK